MADLMRRLADKATVKLQGLERLLCAHLNALACHQLEACQILLDEAGCFPEPQEPEELPQVTPPHVHIDKLMRLVNVHMRNHQLTQKL